MSSAEPAPAAGGEGELKGSGRRAASKKRGDKQRAAADEVEARPHDYVQLKVWRPPAADRGRGEWKPVVLSKADKAQQLALSEDRLSVTGCKGYRSVRATHGAHEGTWYCEVTVTRLGETGGCRRGTRGGRGERGTLGVGEGG
jgi:Set1/Ash2 histone methyltransferase complex subunit ASH2